MAGDPSPPRPWAGSRSGAPRGCARQSSSARPRCPISAVAAQARPGSEPSGPARRHDEDQDGDEVHPPVGAGVVEAQRLMDQVVDDRRGKQRVLLATRLWRLSGQKGAARLARIPPNRLRPASPGTAGGASGRTKADHVGSLSAARPHAWRNGQALDGVGYREPQRGRSRPGDLGTSPFSPVLNRQD